MENKHNNIKRIVHRAMAALVQQTIPKMQQLNEQQFKGLGLMWYKPDEPNKKTKVAEK